MESGGKRLIQRVKGKIKGMDKNKEKSLRIYI